MEPASLSSGVQSWTLFAAPAKTKEWKWAGIKFFNYIQQTQLDPHKFSKRLQTAVSSWKQAFGYLPVLVPIESVANLYEEVSKCNKTEVVARTMGLVAPHFPAKSTTLSESQQQFIHERIVPLKINFIRGGETLINNLSFRKWMSIGLMERITPEVCERLEITITPEFEQVLMLRREIFHKAAHSFFAWCQLMKRERGLDILAEKLDKLALKIDQPNSTEDIDVNLIYDIQFSVWDGLMAADVLSMKTIVLEGVIAKMESVKRQIAFLKAS